jgi:hypothetical protein
MPTKDNVSVSVREFQFHLVQLRTTATTSLPTMRSVNDSHSLSATSLAGLALPLHPDEPAIPEVLRLDTKQRTNLITNLTISMLTHRALMVPRKPSPNLILHRVKQFDNVIDSLTDNATLMVHRLNVSLAPHASSEARIAMRNAITRVAHENDTSVGVSRNLLKVALKRSLVYIDSAEVRVANRIEINVTIFSRELFGYTDNAH